MIVVRESKHGDQAKALANEIKAKLDAGASFEELARVYSDDTQASEGGDWGWVDKTVFSEEMTSIVFSAPGAP